MELFYDKFKNNTLVQDRKTYSEFSDKFGNIKDQETYELILADYNSQKEDINQNFNAFNEFDDNGVIAYLSGNDNKLFSLIGDIIAESLLNNCEIYKSIKMILD